MHARTIIQAAAVLGLLIVAGCAEQEISFKKDIMPILQEKCLSCHKAGGSGYVASGLSMESYDNLMKGTRYGPVIIPGYSFSSTLQILVEHKADSSINMPKELPKLPQNEIELIGKWINQGAKNN
jgi:hypothetical protein